ncbi:MAG: signal peptidase I [Clostridia bacterium]|nr:signal peptidase I [Clostridia bacterium]
MPDQVAKRTPREKGWGILSKLFSLLGNIIFAALLVLIVSMLFFMFQQKNTGEPPKVFGRYMYIVLSGSMSPTFDTGSLIFVKPVVPEEIKEGDVITFSSESREALTTHRVVEVNRSETGEISFITKGDANEVNDPAPVPGDRLVGRLSFSLPYMGYVLNFAQTKKGMLALIIIPGIFVITLEMSKLYFASKASREEEAKAGEIAEENRSTADS